MTTQKQITHPLTDTQINLEKIFAKNQLVKRIKQVFSEGGAGKLLDKAEIPEEFGLDLLAQMHLHKRVKVEVLVAILYHHFEDQGKDPFQACADMLYKACDANLMGWSSPDQRFVVFHQMPDEVQQELDQFQYPLPMVVPPKLLTHNRQTGYLTIKGSLILKKNHHEDDIWLDHLNRLNQTKLSLNPRTVSMVRNQWRNLDKQKDDETFEDFQKRVKAFEKFDRVSRDVIDSLMELGNEFYLTHKDDKRGRVYCQGYHVSYQSSDWNKAVIEFADKELVMEECCD